jgi:hypothetical protein
MVMNHDDSAFNRHPNPARGCAESVNWNLKGARERCRAHARMINVKPSRGEKFFANEGKNAITSQLDIMPEGG